MAQLSAMAKTENKGMRSVLHYVIEFLVILLGITVSVTIEKNNARQYKREVKDQGLTRILANIEQDSLDFVYNIRVHTEAEASCQWMVAHRDQLPEQHPDTIGKHCNRCIMGQTILVDNQEEYRTLQNSGLFEFIENDALARAMQNKYAEHTGLKAAEAFIWTPPRRPILRFTSASNPFPTSHLTATLPFGVGMACRSTPPSSSALSMCPSIMACRSA